MAASAVVDNKLDVSDWKRSGDAQDDFIHKENQSMGAIWRKFDFYVLPVLVIMLLLAFLDRNNIGNARVSGFQRDLNITNKQYSIALTLTFM
ncbi:hypothetical protein NLJ89_g7001 [Agrocybe chaxingu]|uniref:Uncharacterized protein n=1 Tax=Agrocybe chaxingu TaxID=84603 RepID=A0A9W8K4F2_9AGAR|nr:hypothetical protein NLJ89_g7001 [Agrocybe chaxingu]